MKTDPRGAAAPLGTILSLGTAFVLRSLIGVERQLRRRNAGLRTLTLVAVGAAFVKLGGRLRDAAGEARIISNGVSGTGFPGTGMIMKEGAHLRG